MSTPVNRSRTPPAVTKVYTIAVRTGDKFGAGTDSNVYIRLNGRHGSSGDLHLNQSISHRTKFERNKADVFLFSGQPNLGDLVSVQVWHDNSGVGWYLDAVEVHDVKADVHYNFPCNRWLATAADDGQTSRFLPCASKRVKRQATSNPSDKSTSTDSSKQSQKPRIVEVKKNKTDKMPSTPSSRGAMDMDETPKTPSSKKTYHETSDTPKTQTKSNDSTESTTESESEDSDANQ